MTFHATFPRKNQKSQQIFDKNNLKAKAAISFPEKDKGRGRRSRMKVADEGRG